MHIQICPQLYAAIQDSMSDGDRRKDQPATKSHAVANTEAIISSPPSDARPGARNRIIEPHIQDTDSFIAGRPSGANFGTRNRNTGPFPNNTVEILASRRPVSERPRAQNRETEVQFDSTDYRTVSQPSAAQLGTQTEKCFVENATAIRASRRPWYERPGARNRISEIRMDNTDRSIDSQTVAAQLDDQNAEFFVENATAIRASRRPWYERPGARSRYPEIQVDSINGRIVSESGASQLDGQDVGFFVDNATAIRASRRPWYDRPGAQNRSRLSENDNTQSHPES